MKTMELADFQKMEQIRARVDSIVEDPATAEALKPWYRQFCKRPCFHDEYLETFNRPNVTLVDTQGKGVERITPKGVVVGGVEYAVDCLIYATGFEVGTDYTRRAGYEIVGRDGVTLTEKLGGRRAHAARHAQPRLPELLHHGQPAERLHGQLPAHAERAEPARRLHRPARARPRRPHASRSRRRPRRSGWTRSSGSRASASSSSRSARRATTTTRASRGERSGQNGFYGGGSVAFFQLLRDWRNAGELRGLELA